MPIPSAKLTLEDPALGTTPEDPDACAKKRKKNRAKKEKKIDKKQQQKEKEKEKGNSQSERHPLVCWGCPATIGTILCTDEESNVVQIWTLKCGQCGQEPRKVHQEMMAE